MSIIRSSLLLGAGAAAGGYQTERSLRFNSSDSAYLSRTPASAGNRKTWTWAGWVKRSALGTFQYIWGNANLSAENGFMFRFDSEDVIRIADWTNTAVWQKITTQVFRDVSAWYHIVISYDTTNATAADRVRLYVNGSRITAFSTSTDPTQNYDGYINNTNPDSIGRWGNQANYYFNGYPADVHFIDGQALAPSSFTEVSATTGQLIPKAYTGSFGTNGFQLKFADNSSNTAATLGKDTSGNSNNWTPNNLSVTAGAGNDSLVDTPTSYGNDDSLGGSVRGNYATLNPLYNTSTTPTLSNGNLDYSMASADGTGLSGRIATIANLSSGKWYFEVTKNSGTGDFFLGWANPSWNPTINPDGNSNAWAVRGATQAYKTNGGTSTQIFSSYADGDVFMIAVDIDAAKIWLGKNGTWAESGAPASGTNAQFTNLTGSPYSPFVRGAGGGGGISLSCNFGQRAFAYTAPSGFKALCDTNLPSTTITTSGSYTGNGVADGPFVYLNGVPTAMTIGGNAVTFGTHADKLANGFKIRTSSTTYNQNALSYNYSITSTGAAFKNARAQPNP